MPRLVSGIWISFHPDFAKVSVNPEALKPLNITFNLFPTEAVGTKTANFTAVYPVVLSEGLAFERRNAPKVDVKLTLMELIPRFTFVVFVRTEVAL